jgi:hypothetical protein
MKKTALWISALALSACAYAQQDPAAVKYAKYISAEDAKKHLSILASDEYEGRETGKKGADMAAKYIAAELKKLGYQAPVNGSYFLDVPLVEAVFKASAFSINGTSYTFGKDFYAGGASAPRTITASEVIFIGYGSEEELANVDITDKIVMLLGGNKPGTTPDRASRMKMMQMLNTKKPAFVLSPNANLAAMLQRMGGNMGGGRLTIKSDKPVAAGVVTFSITPEQADQIAKNSGKTYAQLRDAANAGVATQTLKANVTATFGSDNKDVKAVDVLGFLPGSDAKLKDEVLVISAHYDHIGLTTSGTDKVNNGADDDGSGTTGVLEIARAFYQAKKDGKGPKRSILFLFNVGEEKGLLGSEYYSDHPVFPLEKTIADLNIDMIGRVGEEYKTSTDSANYVYVIGSAMLSSTLKQVSEKANDTYTKIKLDYKYDDPNDPNRFYYRSDHYNFAKHNVPIIFYFNGVHEDYHKPTDEVKKINFPLLAKRAQLAFYTGWELANRAERPVVDTKNVMPANR